jgi:hypothetical protein
MVENGYQCGVDHTDDIIIRGSPYSAFLQRARLHFPSDTLMLAGQDDVQSGNV